MKNCPNCDFQIKETYKFCPSCKITFDKFEPTKMRKDNKQKHCTDCGAVIKDDYKFCKECGKKVGEKNIVDNSIDNTIQKVKSGIATVQKEFSESKTIENITENTKEIASETVKTAKKAGNKFLRILGIIGLIIIGLMILNPIITDNDFIIKSEFERNFRGSFKSYAGFIGGITAPIILPMIFIYLGLVRSDYQKAMYLVLLFLLIIGCLM